MLGDCVCLNPYSTGSNSNISLGLNKLRSRWSLNPYSTGSNSNGIFRLLYNAVVRVLILILLEVTQIEREEISRKSMAKS